MEAVLLQGLQEWNKDNKDDENKTTADGSDTSDSDEDSSSNSSSEDEEDEAAEDGEDPEEMSKRLGAQLWAEITKAKALEDHPAPTTDATVSQTGQPQASSQPTPATSSARPPTPPAVVRPSRSQKQETVIATIKAIMSLLEKDPAAHAMLATAAVPLPTPVSVLNALKQILTEGKVSKLVAGNLSQSLIALAGSEALFGKLRQSNAPSIQLDLGKRKRDHEQEENQEELHSPAKRRALHSFDLFGTVSEAVRVVATTLQNSAGKGADPTIISSLQTPLHQIFMFAVKSSTRGGMESHILQEVAGLVQVLGVLSGIPIGQNPPPDDPDKQESTDIGTAVYPCTIAGCRKTFARLFSLRNHECAHSSQRPYVCKLCPAAFVRSHDLKRHSRLHEKKVWKCIGCNKVFSRRDAIKRHRNAAEARGVRGLACVEAEPIQVEVEQADHEHAERRGEQLTKLWSDHAGANTVVGEVEEGEIPEDVIHNTQASVMQLHFLLQSYVTHSAGASFVPSTAPPSSDPTAGQATLASVIARAQSQNQTATSEATSAPAPSSEAAPADATNATGGDGAALPSLSMYGLSDEQAKMLEEAITNAALAAQAQAEAEAALEEEDSDDNSSSADGSGDSDDDADMESIAPAPQ